MNLERACATVDGLADWSAWAPFSDGVHAVPRKPGVYLFRRPATHEIVYAGMAGNRSGSGTPQGLRGRLNVYRRGRGAVSGFGEAALDRALGDPDWLAAQVADLHTRGPKRAKVWAQEAIAHLAPEVRWATCSTAAEARRLEAQVVSLLAPHGLWNRTSSSRSSHDTGTRLDATVLGAPGGAAPPAGSASGREVLLVRGHTVDLDVLYREMHKHSSVGSNGERVFAGNAPGVPAVKRLLHTLFGVPVADRKHPVNHAVRAEVRDQLARLGWATKDTGRSGRYVLHRDL